MPTKEQLDALGRPRSKFRTPLDTRDKTVQSDSESADINIIMKRFMNTGIVDQLNITEDMFPDVTEVGDFADVMRIAKDAEYEFMKLPSKVREVFKHDVANWLDTAHDPEKRASLLGEGDPQPVEQPAATDQPTGEGGTPTEGNVTE
jgi:hypothetical protein